VEDTVKRQSSKFEVGAVVKILEPIPNGEVVKASAAIQIENSITLLQRRAWTVLLANAYDELPNKERHQILVKDLMAILEYDSGNRQHLRSTLEALVHCTVKWNLLDRDQHWTWGIASLLAEAEIKEGTGIITYAFGPTLRERLHNPKMYTRISLSLQNRFDSKHALALWEICLDYLDPEKNYGETPHIPLEKYRQLMGIGPERYPAFKTFNWHVIKEPVAEINEKTDFRISVEYKRRARRVNSIKFRFRRILPVLGGEDKQASLFVEPGDIPPTVGALRHAGLDLHSAFEIWEQGFDGVDATSKPDTTDFDAYIQEKIELLNTQKSGSIKNPGGFLRQAIKHNWLRGNKQRKSQSRRQPKANPKLLPQQDTNLDAKIAVRCQQLAQDDPGFLQQAIEAILQDSLFQQQLYDPSLTALENYQKSVSLAASVDQYFQDRRPKVFDDLRAPVIA
jgi:hypothetical protein